MSVSMQVRQNGGSPAAGERRQFWTNDREKRRYLSQRGRRNLPTDKTIEDAPGNPDNWTHVEEGDIRGVGIYEYVPPAPPTPDPVGVVHDEPAVGQVWDELAVGEVREVVAGEVHDPATVNLSSLSPRAAVKTAETAEGGATESPRAAPLGESAMVVNETESSILFQEGSFYTVQDTEVGVSVTLPADEWADHASYLKRGSRR